MRSEQFRSHLRGVIAFPVTPFKPDLSLDLEGLWKNVDQLLRHPVAAIVAAGGTGEMYSLTPAEHQAVVKTIVEQVQGRIPVIAGTGFNRQMAIDSWPCRPTTQTQTKKDSRNTMRRLERLLLWACSSTVATG